MLKFGVATSELQQPAWCPPGIYEFRVVDFKPKAAKSGKSTNLNPRLEIVNTPGNFLCDDKDCANKHFAGGQPGHSYNGCMPAFLTGNNGAMWIMEAMVHSLGLEMVEEEDATTHEPTSFIPGGFEGVAQNPSSWKYVGPLIDPQYTGKLEVSLVEAKNAAGAVIGNKNNIKQFFCKLPGCTVRHASDMK